MTERASRLSQSRCAAISRLFVRAMLSLCQCFSGSILALSVCFAATSPKGRGTGEEVKLCGMRKPLPLGEVAAKQTERACPSPESRCAAISRPFVRAMLSPRLRFTGSVLALSGAPRQLSQRESLLHPVRQQKSTHPPVSRERMGASVLSSPLSLRPPAAPHGWRP